MKRTLVIVTLLTLALSTLTTLANAQAKDWQHITIPPLPAFHPKEPKRIELPNGMVIFLQEDHELPLINGIARVRGGSRGEPASKVGMLDMYGEVWRTGGTKDQTGDQLDDFLEVRAAKVETGANADSTSISWSCLKGDFDDVFKLFTDLLRDPAFRADKLDLAQREMNDGISRRNDDVSEIAQRVSSQLAYGKDSPYARDPEYSTVAAVTQQDLIQWHHAHVYPNNIILGVLGDFDSATMEARLREAFAKWPKGPAHKDPEIKLEPAKPGYYLVPKSDVNQSNIRMVELGIKKDNPDFFAAQVFNEAFGGGFSSRLFRSIRSAKGLAYGVGGGIGSAFDHLGIERISMGTKSQSTVESIKALYEEIDALQTKPITDDEIKLAKDSILNSFVFNFDSPEKVLRERMAYEFYGYPADFLERFRSGIEKVQAPDVQRVVTRYVHKDQFKVLVVGNTSEFDKPLADLGPVTNVDISIPPPPGEKNATSAGKPPVSNPQGKALAAKAVDAMGGLSKLQSVKSVREDMTEKESETGQALELHVTIQFPDRMHVDLQTPNRAVSVVVTPEAGFMSAAGVGVRDMPSAQKDETLQQIHRNLLYIGQHLNDPQFVFAAAGKETVAGVSAEIVDVSSPDVSIRWFVDPSNGHVIREDYEAVGRAGPFHGETDLSDWKTTDGITLPVMHTNKENGKQTSTAESTKIEFNPQIDPKLFEKPPVQNAASPSQ